MYKIPKYNQASYVVVAVVNAFVWFGIYGNLVSIFVVYTE